MYLCLIIYVQIANIAKHKSIVLWFVLNTCVLYREVFKKLYRLFWFHHKTNLLCEQIWTEPTFSVPRNREATQTWKFGTVKKLYILRILTLLLQIQCKKKKLPPDILLKFLSDLTFLRFQRCATSNFPSFGGLRTWAQDNWWQ